MDFEKHQTLTLSPHSHPSVTVYRAEGPRLRTTRPIGSRLHGVDPRFSTRGNRTPRGWHHWETSWHHGWWGQCWRTLPNILQCILLFYLIFCWAQQDRKSSSPNVSSAEAEKPWPGATESWANEALNPLITTWKLLWWVLDSEKLKIFHTQPKTLLRLCYPPPAHSAQQKFKYYLIV